MATMGSILDYWQQLETLTPFPAPRVESGNNYACYPSSSGWPWQPGHPLEKKKTPRFMRWGFVLYGGIYDIARLAEMVDRASDSIDGGREEWASGQGCAFSIAADAQGNPLPESLQISAAAWLLGHAGEGTPVCPEATQVAKTAEHLRGDIATLVRDAKESGRKVAPAEIFGVVAAVMGIDDFVTRNPDGSPAFFISCRLESTRNEDTQAEAESGLISSFYIDDLQRVRAALEKGHSSPALDGFMQPQIDDAQRQDVRQDVAAFAGGFAVDLFPPARWPAATDSPLVASQQFAVNRIFRSAGWRWHDGRIERGEGGLFAVNGPPGTGKTTLLRDVIAGIVTLRAMQLSRLDKPEDGFLDKRSQVTTGGARAARRISHLIPELLGFEIVVASNNNGAVENVVLDIPHRRAIAEEWHGMGDEVDFWPAFGESLMECTGSEDKAWGLLAARLGNRTNCNVFIDKFWQSAFDNGTGHGGFISYLGKCSEDPSFAMRQISANAEVRAGIVPETFENAAQWKQEAWSRAVIRFRRAVEAEERCRQDRRRAEDASGTDKAASLRHRIEELTRNLSEAADAHAAMTERHDALAQRLKQQNLQYRNVMAFINREMVSIPTRTEDRIARLIRKLSASSSTTWLSGAFMRLWMLHAKQPPRIGVRWHERIIMARRDREAIVQEGRRMTDNLNSLDRQINESKEQSARWQQDLTEKSDELRIVSDEIINLRNKFEDVRPDPATMIGEAETRESASPWMTDDWNRVRAVVFLEALRLTKTFVVLNADRLRANMGLAADMIGGLRIQSAESADAVRHAWASLFMVVPVVSTTLASFSRVFSTLKQGELGWLLLDEAGQATPQSAVGALWRAQQAVVVGDPMQVEPVISLPASAQRGLAAQMGVSLDWMPAVASAQTLADRASRFGTMLHHGDGTETWVGSPLRVHRRCERTIFDISNRVAYSGLMVYGTREERSSLPPSTWIDVHGKQFDDHWVAEEGEVLAGLVDFILSQREARNVFLVSPFRAVANRLKDFVSRLEANITVGTVHAVQGKEADVVILVLGGHHERHGAKAWASSRPNLVNVAVSRARRRLYVIGDRESWSRYRHFSVMAEMLPAIDAASDMQGWLKHSDVEEVAA